MPKYFIYCRKSSDAEDRQVLSIESQLQELRDYASQNNLEVVKVFTESRTAKEPGRPIFNQMLLELEQGRAEGIIAWHPDRLARNSVDGGKIIHLIDQRLIADLKFPSYLYDNSPHGKFNLSLAFSFSKLYVDNLSENVKRGIREKLRRGEFPGKAPRGYINHHKTHSIEPDPEHFEIVKHLLERFAAGDISQKGMIDTLYLSGIKAKTGRPIVFGALNKILTNTFYYGVFKLKGELYQGSHQPMISKKTFDQIQKRLETNPQRINFRKKLEREAITFLFPGLAQCADCGHTITYEFHRKRNSKVIFKYYRCTHKSNKKQCTQRKYIREEKLAEQVKEQINSIAINNEIYQMLKAWSYEWAEEDTDKSKVALHGLKQELESIKTKLTSLLDLHIDGEISLNEYKAKKNELIERRIDIQEKTRELESGANSTLEQELNFLKTCKQAHKSLEENNFSLMNQILQEVGSNRKIDQKVLSLDWIRPFDFLREFQSQTNGKSSHDENQALNYSNSRRDSSVSLVKQDRTAVCERRSREQANSPKGCEHPQKGQIGLEVSKWRAL